MKKVRWVIQDNLIAENDLNQLQEACTKLGLPFKEIRVVPFSEELPEFPIDEYENIYYGSTTLMDNIYRELNKPSGLFYNHETFSMENYLKQWGEYMLSDAAEFMTVEEFINNFNMHHQLKWFIRPDGDGKQFDGVVGLESELKEMLTKATAVEGGPIKKDLKMLVNPAYNIQREWRNYIVNGKVITSSRYRKNFRLSKSGTDIPEDMIKFVEDRCKDYQPHDVFAMDIGEVRDDSGEINYYIIECGCMNSVGFYESNIFDYVQATTKYIENL